jgi:hypothetical protein
MMKLSRKYRLASLKGYSVCFEKGVPVWVPPAIAAEAMHIGAEAVEEKDKIDLTPAEEPAPNTGPSDAATREEQIMDAIQVIVATNERDSFSAAGLPKAAPISALLGYKVDKREIETVWNKRSEMIVAGMLNADGSRIV